MTNKEIIKRIYSEISKYRFALIISMFCMAMVAGFTGIQAYMVKDLLDKIFMEKNLFYLKLLPVAVIIVFFVKSLFYYTYSVLLEKVGQSVIRDLRISIFAHIHRQPLAFFHDMPTGTLISRVLNDVTLMQQAVSTVIVQILRDGLQVIILLGVVFYMNWRLALITFFVLPLASIPIIKFAKVFRRLSTSSQEETAGVSNILHETIAGSRIVKAFCKEDYEVKRFHNQIFKLFAITMKDAIYRAIQHPMMELIGGVAVAGVIWVGGREVIEGGSTPGTFFAFVTAMAAAYDPIKRVSQINSTLQQGFASAERVFAILDIVPAIEDKEEAKELAPFKKQIEFRNVTYKYGEEEVLSNINLTVPAGQALAIVGPSGGGKTTLTNLVPRFLDLKEGGIIIDGVDIRDITMKSLREQIAMVTQDTILFNDSIKNNIAYGRDNSSAEEIRMAAKAAHALDFIEDLPNGFETMIGEGGAKLSGGQRQRLSIARALLADTPILILDEATSALDTESEREVQKALENLMKNRTTFVIAHRLSTIKNADRIIVVKKGCIVEEGTHDNLLEKKGIYQSLYNMQL
ncbi:MAG: lipid A export permease/ATP-binding protein MsbA [Desulfotalea sp.]